MGQIVYERPAIINKYKKQKDFLDAPTRNAIVEATSKAGKTVGCIVWLFEQAISPYGFFTVVDDKIIPGTKPMNDKSGCFYWWVAPVSDVTEIAFKRMRRFISHPEIYSFNLTRKTITLKNGATIVFKSGDNPDSLYGEDVYAVVMDESTRMKEDAYIAVDSTMTATGGLFRIIGNVKGTNNWSYKLAREVELGKLKDWSYYKLTAADAVDAGVLKQSVLDEKRSRLPEGVFLELYYAIPFVNSSNKFAYSFDPKKSAKPCSIDYNYPIYLSFDFNRNPIACVVHQIIGEKKVNVPFVIKLENSNIYRLCDYLKTKFIHPDYNRFIPDMFIVNGDATGRASSALVEDNLNYFRVIKEKLDLATGQMQQLPNNPKIAQNQLLINAIYEHFDISIDPTNAQPLIFDLQFAEMLPDGTLKKSDRNDPTQQLDALDCHRYFLNRNFAHFYKTLE